MEGGVRAAVYYVGSGGSGGSAACPKVWFRVHETILFPLQPSEGPWGSEAYSFVCRNTTNRSFMCSENRKSLFWARKKPLRAPAPGALHLKEKRVVFVS